MVDSTAKRIEAAIGSEVEGKIIFSSDYAEMGTPEAIKKSLIRLCERNVIIRLAHGIYYKPKYDKELGLGMLYQVWTILPRLLPNVTIPALFLLVTTLSIALV